jgi:DNA-directed RNA polymerase specialized sigma24 family protein
MKKKKVTQHYVDNKKFLEEMTKFRNKVLKAQDSNRKRPMVTNYIGECFLKIANHLAYRPNFINYTFRDDMISDGVENCLQYMDNFNPEKSKNPFAYFTQIIYYAFIRRIQKEKKQVLVKQKIIANTDTDEFLTQLDGDDGQYKNQMIEFLKANQGNVVEEPKTKKQKKQDKQKNLEKFMK